MDKIDIKIHTYGNKYPKATQKIIDNCNLYIVDGVAHFQGIVNREDWHIQAIQMRTSAGGYKPADILNAIINYGYKGSKATFDNFLSKFAKTCDFTYPPFEKISQVNLKPLNQRKISRKSPEKFYPQDVYDDCVVSFSGEPIETFTNGEECNFNVRSQRSMTGKIVGDGTEDDLMFKDLGCASIDDGQREGEFAVGELRLLNKIKH